MAFSHSPQGLQIFWWPNQEGVEITNTNRCLTCKSRRDSRRDWKPRRQVLISLKSCWKKKHVGCPRSKRGEMLSFQKKLKRYVSEKVQRVQKQTQTKKHGGWFTTSWRISAIRSSSFWSNLWELCGSSSLRFLFLDGRQLGCKMSAMPWVSSDLWVCIGLYRN